VGKILVTGASGVLGRKTLLHLLKRKPANQLVGLVRDPSKAGELAGAGVELRQGDYLDPESLSRSFEGVEKLMLISTHAFTDRNTAHANVIDAAVIEWGFAAGPVERLDDLGIDVASQVAEGLHAAFGARMTPPGALATLVADGRRGRKNGHGIYRYGPDARAPKRAIDPGAYTLLGVQPRTKLPAEEIQLRCALAMVNEAVRCFGDGVLRDPRDGDVGAIFGLGFPRFRGGPFRYVDTIGAADVLRRVQAYADRFGDRWRPAPLLVQMAKKGERFFA